jgi:hypothetical protein
MDEWKLFGFRSRTGQTTVGRQSFALARKETWQKVLPGEGGKSNSEQHMCRTKHFSCGGEIVCGQINQRGTF